MKFCKTLICFLAAFAAAYAQSNNIEGIRKAIIDEAALLAIEQSIASLQQQQRSADQLAAVILSDPMPHARHADSEKLVLDGERKFLDNAVRQELATFASTRSDLPPGWVDQVMVRQRSRIDKTVEGILAASFSDRFNRAREIAVAEQRGKLSLSLTPSFKDVEDLAGPYRAFADLPIDEAQRQALNSGAALIAKRAAAAHAGQVVFEENEAYLKEQASEAFSREITELWQQLHYIVQHTGAGEIEASRIEAAIAKGMSSLPSRHKAFPITRTAIHERALELERKLYLDYLEAQLKSCSALPAEVILKRVPSEVDKLPRTLDEHVQDILPMVREQTATVILDNWTARIPPPSRTDLQRKLKQLSNESPGEQILTDGLAHCAREALRSFREMAAAKELSARWPDGADLSLQFDDAVITKINNQATVNQDELLPSPKFHLEESEKAFAENRQALIEEATNSVRAQMSLARDANRAERYQHELSLNPTPTRKRQVQAEYEEDVLGGWNQQRPGILKRVNGHLPNPAKYQSLFLVVREEIRNLLKRDELQSAVAQKTVQAQTGTAGPGGGGPGSGGGAGPGIGPGSGADDGGGGGGGGNCPPCPPSELHDRVVIWLAGLFVCMVGAYFWGRKNGVRKAIIRS